MDAESPKFARQGLIVVDMQNDFAEPDGALFVLGGDTIVSTVNDMIAHTQASGGFVVYTQDWHPPTTPHFYDDGGVWPVHCVRDTWGADLHRDLAIVGPIVRKGTGGEDGYSGFTMQDPITGEKKLTELHDMLRAEDVGHVTVIGLALDVCVKATALDAVANGYTVRVARDASAAVNLDDGDGDRAEAELVAAGVTLI